MATPPRTSTLAERQASMRAMYANLDKVAPTVGLTENDIRAVKIYGWQESSGNVTAQNTKSSAAGHFQFLKPTWDGKPPRQVGLRNMHKELQSIEHGSQAFFKPETQALAIAVFVRSLKSEMRHHLDIPRDTKDFTLSSGELYMAHKYGARKASELLMANDDIKISTLLSSTIIENHKTISEQGIAFKDFTVANLKQWVSGMMVARTADYAKASQATDIVGELAKTANDLFPNRISPSVQPLIRIPSPEDSAAISTLIQQLGDNTRRTVILKAIEEAKVCFGRNDPNEDRCAINLIKEELAKHGVTERYSEEADSIRVLAKLEFNSTHNPAPSR